jgi:hydrogenase maturation protease
MSEPWAAVVGVGNRYRRDDAVGLRVVAGLRATAPAGVRLACVDGEPTRLMDAWGAARLVVVVDAARCRPATPGRIHRLVVRGRLPDGVAASAAAGSHGLGVPEAVELARLLDRLPRRLVLLTVEVADAGLGDGLSPAVEAAVPHVLAAVHAELDAAGRTGAPAARDFRP